MTSQRAALAFALTGLPWTFTDDADRTGTDGTAADGAGAVGAGTDGAGTDGAGTDGAGTDGTATDTHADDSARVIALLDAGGWPAARIADHARATLDAGDVWPHPVAPEVLADYGPARFHAALAELRQQLGVWTTAPQPPSRRATLTADERRLLAEVPPHHVG